MFHFEKEAYSLHLAHRTGSAGHPVKVRSTGWPVMTLEVEVVDVVLVEHCRLAQQLGAVFGYRVIAQLARGVLVAGVALDLARGDSINRVDGEVPEVRRVPQLEGRGGPALDVGAHLVGRAQTRDHHLADLVGVRDGASRCRDTYCGGRDDALEVG